MTDYSGREDPIGAMTTVTCEERGSGDLAIVLFRAFDGVVFGVVSI